MTEQKEETPKPSWLKTNWLFLLIGLVITGYLSWAIWYWQCHPDKAGQFGDMFGAVTSVLTFLTVVLLIKSINLQSEELKNSVAALKHSAKELELTRQEFEKQNVTSAEQLATNVKIRRITRLQRIETTFFKMLELFVQSRNIILLSRLDNEFDVRLTGNMIFQAILERTNSKFYLEAPARQVQAYEPADHQYYVNKYTTKHEVDEMMQQYYHHLNNLFSLICDSKLSLERSKFYLRILKAYLANNEELVLQFLFIGLHPLVSDSVKKFAIKTDYFKDVIKNLFPVGSESFYKIMYPNYGNDTIQN